MIVELVIDVMVKACGNSSVLPSTYIKAGPLDGAAPSNAGRSLRTPQSVA